MTTKKCYACSIEKPITNFSFKNKAKSVRCAECKTCHKQYNAQWYQKNKIIVSQRTKKTNKLYRERAYTIANKLKSVPCADCKQSFPPIAMDFDHLEQFTKDDCIAHMIYKGRNLDLILAEIKKCEVVCAVCHRIRTYNRLQLKKQGQ